ncbi:uncharacterized protein [Parasteatoda tepidariorum]|uniref:uncharacterized protein isoform X1 n=1 Tax=Parasteatoda tepidariorum TaxID=114398 RepID=UPI0039BC2985
MASKRKSPFERHVDKENLILLQIRNTLINIKHKLPTIVSMNQLKTLPMKMKPKNLEMVTMPSQNETGVLEKKREINSTTDWSDILSEKKNRYLTAVTDTSSNTRRETEQTYYETLSSAIMKTDDVESTSLSSDAVLNRTEEKLSFLAFTDSSPSMPITSEKILSETFSVFVTQSGNESSIDVNELNTISEMKPSPLVITNSYQNLPSPTVQMSSEIISSTMKVTNEVEYFTESNVAVLNTISIEESSPNFSPSAISSLEPLFSGTPSPETVTEKEVSNEFDVTLENIDEKTEEFIKTEFSSQSTEIYEPIRTTRSEVVDTPSDEDDYDDSDNSEIKKRDLIGKLEYAWQDKAYILVRSNNSDQALNQLRQSIKKKQQMVVRNYKVRSRSQSFVNEDLHFNEQLLKTHRNGKDNKTGVSEGFDSKLYLTVLPSSPTTREGIKNDTQPISSGITGKEAIFGILVAAIIMFLVIGLCLKRKEKQKEINNNIHTPKDKTEECKTLRDYDLIVESTYDRVPDDCFLPFEEDFFATSSSFKETNLRNLLKHSNLEVTEPYEEEYSGLKTKLSDDDLTSSDDSTNPKIKKFKTQLSNLPSMQQVEIEKSECELINIEDPDLAPSNIFEDSLKDLSEVLLMVERKIGEMNRELVLVKNPEKNSMAANEPLPETSMNIFLLKPKRVKPKGVKSFSQCRFFR